MNLYAYILREDMLRSYNFTLLCISIDKFALLLCKFYNNGVTILIYKIRNVMWQIYLQHSPLL